MHVSLRNLSADAALPFWQIKFNSIYYQKTIDLSFSHTFTYSITVLLKMEVYNYHFIYV